MKSPWVVRSWKLLFSTPSAMPRKATAVPRGYCWREGGQGFVGYFGVDGHYWGVWWAPSPPPSPGGRGGRKGAFSWGFGVWTTLTLASPPSGRGFK